MMCRYGERLRETESLRVAMSHAGQWLNTARRVLAHVRAYLDSGHYGERRDNEQACLRVCRHGEYCVNLKFGIYFSLSRSST